MFFLLQCILLIPFVFGGSKCPPRSEIYPCICINSPLVKRKMETTLICHGLEDDSSLQVLESALKDMEVDKFLLFDSFWKMVSKKTQGVPVNVLNGYKLREVEIIDSSMKHFDCPVATSCGTTFLRRLISQNSSLSDKMSCNNNPFSVNAWVSCPESIEFLEINDGLPHDMNLKADFFPQPMTKLKVLHLPNNRIAKVDKRTFSINKFPVLHTLDLSHNDLRDAKILFSAPMKIKHLDLSYNSLRSLLDLGNLPDLLTLKLVKTQIITIIESDWKNVPEKLMLVDLSNNSIKCECTGFRWANSTFPIHTNLLGVCNDPPEMKNMKLRKASRALIERCDDEGNIGKRVKSRRLNHQG